MSTSMTARGSGGMSLFSSIECSTGLNLFFLVRTQIDRRERRSLFGVRIRVDDTRLADDLTGQLPSGASKEGIVARLMREYSCEIGSSGVPANKEALSEVRFEEGRVLDDLKVRREGEEWTRSEIVVWAHPFESGEAVFHCGRERMFRSEATPMVLMTEYAFRSSGLPVLDVHSGQFEVHAQLAQEVIVELDAAYAPT